MSTPLRDRASSHLNEVGRGVHTAPLAATEINHLPDAIIVTLRQEKILLAAALAALYGVPNKALNQGGALN